MVILALILSSLKESMLTVCFFMSNKSLSAIRFPFLSLIITLLEIVRKPSELEYSALSAVNLLSYLKFYYYKFHIWILHKELYHP